MPNDTLTIYLVCPEFPPVQTGGGAYVYRYLAEEWSEHSFVVVLATDYTQSGIKKGSEGQLTIIPLPLVRVTGDPPELIARMPPTQRAFVRMLRTVVGARFRPKTKHQIANLHGLGHPGVDIAGFLFWLVRIPFVVTVHGFPGSHSRTIASRIYRVYERLITTWILGRAAAVIAISADVRRLLMQRYIDSEVIANAIRVDTEVGDESVSVGEKRQLLCVGRLAADKGFQYAIQALERLTSEYPELSLRILGDDFGAQADLLRGIPSSVSHRVVFGGRVERKSVLREMSSAVAVLIPSLNEPFGLVALEALSVGAVVIASRSGALPEIIQHEENGLLVDTRSADGIATAVRRILEDKDLEKRLRRNAPKRARDFSTETAAARYIGIFRGVLHTDDLK